MDHDVFQAIPEIAINASRYPVLQVLVVPQVGLETAAIVRGKRASERRALVQMHDVIDEQHLLERGRGLPGTSRLQGGHGVVLEQHPLRGLGQFRRDELRVGRQTNLRSFGGGTQGDEGRGRQGGRGLLFGLVGGFGRRGVGGFIAGFVLC